MLSGIASVWQASETSHTSACSPDLPCRYRRRQTFEFDGAEALALEQTADLPASRGVGHHLVRSGQTLQTCREVRRLTDRRLAGMIRHEDRPIGLARNDRRLDELGRSELQVSDRALS